MTILTQGDTMIVGFKCRETERIWYGYISVKLPVDIQKTARRKLRMMNNAFTLTDLIVLPGNRLEHLRGTRKGQLSIRINSQWRICFKWVNGNCAEVEIIDYHR